MNSTKSTAKQLYAQAVGELVLNFLEATHPDFASATQSSAVELIAKIKIILDDKELDDPDCFQRIESIVEQYHAAGLHTSRHNF